MEQWQYFSKWREEWVDFKNPPTDGDFFELKKYQYQTRTIKMGEAEQIYYHPNVKSRLTLRRKDGNIGSFSQIDEAKVYNVRGELVYTTAICDMQNLCDEATWKELQSKEQLTLF